VRASDLKQQQQSAVWVIEWQTKFTNVRVSERVSHPMAMPLAEDEAGHFSDALVTISGSYVPPKGEIEIMNAAEISARIIWDEASYTNENGVASQLTHSGVEFSERLKAQRPTI